MTQILPLLLLGALLAAMIVISRRNKQRLAAADSLRRERITTGTDVMTTSGLYGTVVSVNPDGTVLLSVAPGVEVRWTIAALREVDELPAQYREPIAGSPQQLTAEQLTAEQLTAEQPVAEQPTAGRPAAEQPGSRLPRADGSNPN